MNTTLFKGFTSFLQRLVKQSNDLIINDILEVQKSGLLKRVFQVTALQF